MYDVVCIGNVAVDEFYRVTHLPGPDEKVFARYLGKILGGTTCNTARAILNLGDNVLFITHLGHDDAGSFIDKKFNEIHLPSRIAWQNEGASYTTVVMVAENGEKAILLLPPDNSQDDLDPFADFPLEDTKVIFSTGDQTDLKYLEKYACPVVVSLESSSIEKDPDTANWVFEHVHSLILDSNGFQAVFHQDISPTNIKNVMQDKSVSIVNLLVTLGSKGSLAYSRYLDQVVFCNAYPVKPIDTTAAGDIFTAAYIHAYYLNHFALDESIRFANAIAAASCEEIGTELSKNAIKRAKVLLSKKGGHNNPNSFSST